jgi:hypothetical protein
MTSLLPPSTATGMQNVLAFKIFQVHGFSAFMQAPKQVLQNSRSLLPGDTLTTSCTYSSSSSSSNSTLGPCINYLHYYPAVNGEFQNKGEESQEITPEQCPAFS